MASTESKPIDARQDVLGLDAHKIADEITTVYAELGRPVRKARRTVSRWLEGLDETRREFEGRAESDARS